MPEVEDHDHDFSDYYGTTTYPGFGGLVISNYAYAQMVLVTEPTTAAGVHTHSGTTDSAGSSLPFDNRPAYYRVIFIVKS